jgi:hypothetical protein
MKKRLRTQIAITLNSDVLDFIDKESINLGMNRSRLIENCLMMAVDDLKVLKKMGLLEAVKVIQGFQERVKREVFSTAH